MSCARRLDRYTYAQGRHVNGFGVKELPRATGTCTTHRPHQHGREHANGLKHAAGTKKAENQSVRLEEELRSLICLANLSNSDSDRSCCRVKVMFMPLSEGSTLYDGCSAPNAWKVPKPLPCVGGGGGCGASWSLSTAEMGSATTAVVSRIRLRAASAAATVERHSNRHHDATG